ncbi:TcpQ domain-containing protein [Paracidovorax wautersii]|uniref:Toxin co-regulated pilus biosynthesis protein Q n=1 Tax=Paracidovorax wautersii TaxID=1177982 RepID=A0A1I2HT50_9BURK|nr:TcpQ domain-containing protein [Paracidovorax wautersii]SFF31906.1 Toxin co-regulated pilus biosynthesis protein Q [Paracidovorax wautersii]
MRIPMAVAVVAVFISAGAAAEQQVIATRGPVVPAAQKPEVLKAGTGSFASYLNKAGQTAPAAASPPSVPAFVLKKGELVHVALQAWATAAGWELIWYPDRSWKVLGDTTIEAKDVTQAIADVVTILRDERRPVRLEIADGNRIMEVINTDVVSNEEAFGD